MKTLHALLGLSNSWDLSPPPKSLGADLVLVDEASMIDVALLVQLFRALKPGCHLVLMGDPDQLPPVEAGNLFADLVDALPAAVVRLTRCLRTDLEPIVQLANLIRQGEADAALALLQQGGAVRLRPARSPADLVQAIWPPGEGEPLLTPLRKGEWGCDLLNRRIGERLLRSQPLGSRLSLPILVARNDHQLGLFNGEMGELTASVTGGSLEELLGEPKALATFPGRKEPLPSAILPPCEIAFALSIHKAQGSEFDRVAIAVPPQAEGWSKELLYTAVTRAKRRVTLLGATEELARVIPLSTRRHSGILNRLARCAFDVEREA